MKVIVIGCGRMGSGLARTLSQRGHEVTVIDSSPRAFERLGPRFKGQTAVGIGFDRDVLVGAGIERADALAAVTSSDEANLVAARLASQIFKVPRVVARVYDPQKADIYRRLGLQTIAPVAWGIERLADLLLFAPFSTTVCLGAGQVDLVEIEVTPALVGRTVGALTVTGEVQVVTITRDGRTFLPTPSADLREGDLLHVAVSCTAVDRFREMLG